MPIDFLQRCDVIEECYEFMLAYAGQGLPSDATSPSGSRIRDFLQRAAHALSGIAASCADSLSDEGIQTLQPYEKFISVLNRDAQDSLAAIQVVLAQPSISSQLIDNLNASLHLRALLTDLFLLGEVVRSRRQAPVALTPE
jgi:hypothetical protein